MESIKNFIKNLATPPSNRVGIYISSDSKIEVVYYNVDTQEIYGSQKSDFQYNQILREVLLDDLESVILNILNKMNIPANCPICICFPNILTSIKPLPSDLEDFEIELALTSEAEKSYIFKKTEPKPSWSFLSENKENLTNIYLYSIIQKAQAEKVGEIFEKNGLKLFAIDVSFTALLRGLESSGILNENLENHHKWCVAIISANNYLIAKFEGEKLLNIIENPLALRSIEPDVLYPTLNNTLTEKLQHEKLSNLYIVSQTQSFIAAKLAEHIKLMCNIHTIDNDKFNNNPLFINPVASVEPISPESIGAACWKRSKLNLNLNFHDKEDKEEIHGLLGQLGIKKPVHLYLLIWAFSSFFVIFTITLLLFGINSYLNYQVSAQNSEIKNLEKFNVKPTKEFDESDVFLSVYNKNLELLTSYDSIGAVIPEKLWVDSFFIDNELQVKITGKAYKVEDIVIYFENLQNMAKFKNLKIKSIKIISVATSTKNNLDLNDSNASNSYKNEFDRERSPGGAEFDLPPPPMPDTLSVQKQNYYQFIFTNYEVKPKKEPSFLDNLPGFAKNIIFGN